MPAFANKDKESDTCFLLIPIWIHYKGRLHNSLFKAFILVTVILTRLLLMWRCKVLLCVYTHGHFCQAHYLAGLLKNHLFCEH